jgi:anti-anti-sigma factor
VFRVQSSLLYFNVDHVLETVRQRAAATTGLQRVICDLSNVPYVDIAGARLLRRLHEEFQARDVSFQLVEAHGPVREMLRAEGLEEKTGPITRLESLSDLLSQVG